VTVSDSGGLNFNPTTTTQRRLTVDKTDGEPEEMTYDEAGQDGSLHQGTKTIVSWNDFSLIKDE
jgi:hypothetical protein